MSQHGALVIPKATQPPPDLSRITDLLNTIDELLTETDTRTR